MNKQCFDFELCYGTLTYGSDGNIDVSGYIRKGSRSGKLLYWAPSPVDYRSSYTGSGLPFPSTEQAFENTPNRGVVDYNKRIFKFKVQNPNAYYKSLGSEYVKPHIAFKLVNNNHIFNIVLNNEIPFRSLTHPIINNTRINPNFYDGRDNLPVRTQEDIIRSSSYGKMPNNFWGLKPPQ